MFSIVFGSYVNGFQLAAFYMVSYQLYILTPTVISGLFHPKENGRCITKLENMGFRVGQGLIERYVIMFLSQTCLVSCTETRLLCYVDEYDIGSFYFTVPAPNILAQYFLSITKIK